mmetsp:Transcript_101946/g.283999  ORF Transcript_101946/g.283999 Transcript_101946/m.283999 type:complete len:208 (+) Transcript_101946:175-798(+)
MADTETKVEGTSREPASGDDAIPPAGGMHADVEKVLFTEAQIRTRVAEMGAALSEELKDKDPLVVGVLTGAFVFVADLCRAMTIPLTPDFLAASSYGKGSVSSGTVKIIKDLQNDPSGRHVVIVEDIVDSGLTLMTLGKMFEARGAASVRFVTLFDKAARREHPIPDLAHVGFPCPDAFIIGYGIDYAQKYRNLPYVGVLKPSVYSK